MGERSAHTRFGDGELEELVGARLSAVTFVMDYVQLAFDGPTLNAYTWPTIHVGERMVRPGDASYRDELCARIGGNVAAARVLDDAIEIALAGGSTIRISLRSEDLSDGTPEAAVLIGRDWIVFRPGDL